MKKEDIKLFADIKSLVTDYGWGEVDTVRGVPVSVLRETIENREYVKEAVNKMLDWYNENHVGERRKYPTESELFLIKFLDEIRFSPVLED